MDVLSEILRALRLTGTVYFEADFSAPWGMAMNRGEFANFHIVTSGRCFARVNDDVTVLDAGDVVLFPHGCAHDLLHAPKTTPAPAQEVLASMVQRTDGLHYGNDIGDDVQRTRLICGHFTYDRKLPNPLLATLPAIVVVRKQQGDAPSWVDGATRLLVAETARAGPGSTAIVDRLAEALLMHILRAYADALDVHSPLRVALEDETVGQALALLHQAPARKWTVSALANAVGVSRSVLAARFKSALDVGPMQYLFQWRMQRARELLAATGLSLAELSDSVGYDSEFAFAKAFKRSCGLAPGAFRRQAQKSEGTA